MTKLEEIARAIGDARCDAGRPDPGKGLDEFIARAVLSTLKTPTTAMKMAGAIAITAGSENRRKTLPWLTKPLLRKAVFRRFDQISGQNRPDLNQYLRVRTQNQSGRKAASTAPGPGTRRGNFA